MKKKDVVSWALLAALLVTGCPNDGGNGGGGATIRGDELELFGEVWLEKQSPINRSISYERFNGTVDIDDNGLGGIGAITNGMFQYSIGVPETLYPATFFEDVFGELGSYGDYDDVEFSDSTVQGTFFYLFYSVDSASNYVQGLLFRRSRTYKEASNASATETLDHVGYAYVDRDLTITGIGKTIGGATTKSFNLALKKGWNAIHWKGTYTHESTGGMIVKEQWSLGDPSSLKWVLRDGLD
ncbi:MAG: hypothetical protein LBQ69_03770 [Treponema sp.]|nr:hypothetical protein [Treponema sp.]